MFHHSLTNAASILSAQWTEPVRTRPQKMSHVSNVPDPQPVRVNLSLAQKTTYRNYHTHHVPTVPGVPSKLLPLHRKEILTAPCPDCPRCPNQASAVTQHKRYSPYYIPAHYVPAVPTVPGVPTKQTILFCKGDIPCPDCPRCPNQTSTHLQDERHTHALSQMSRSNQAPFPSAYRYSQTRFEWISNISPKHLKAKNRYSSQYPPYPTHHILRKEYLKSRQHIA